MSVMMTMMSMMLVIIMKTMMIMMLVIIMMTMMIMMLVMRCMSQPYVSHFVVPPPIG